MLQYKLKHVDDEEEDKEIEEEDDKEEPEDEDNEEENTYEVRGFLLRRDHDRRYCP